VAEVKMASAIESSPRRKPGPITAASGGPGFRRDDERNVRPRASTAARAAARRSGTDLAKIRGSGRNGRITRADLASAQRPARATYHVETAHGKIFFREWPAQGVTRGNALLIHGLFADSQSFTTLGRKLAAAGYRTYALDLPGHGETLSQAASLDDVAAAVKAALPAQRFHIAAHSYGALAAARLLDQALSLMLLSPAGCGEEINGEFVDAMLGAHIDHASRFLGETIPPEAQASLMEHLATNSLQLGAIAKAVAADGRQRVSILSALAEAKAPVKAVFMRDDAVIPAHHALNMPFNVGVHIMQGASHLPHWRNPDAVAAMIAAGT
jgi:pimeloyl-ACP methyl ester carboxylesterase